MQNRTTRPTTPLTQRLTMAMLACAALSAASGAADAAEDCLAKPKGNAAAGQHWYYRIERPSQRHCWYLGEAGAKTSDKTSDKASEAAKTSETTAKTADAADDERAPRSRAKVVETAAPKRAAASSPKPGKTGAAPPVADARAELIDPARQDQPSSAPPQQDAVPDVTGGMTNRAWSVASRWADPSAPSSLDGIVPAAGNLLASAGDPPLTTNAQDLALATGSAGPTGQTPPQAAAPAAAQDSPPAADSNPPSDNQGTDYLLLALCLSTLGFAIFLAFAIFRAPRRTDALRFAGGAFSSEVATGSREENATKQESRLFSRFKEKQKQSRGLTPPRDDPESHALSSQLAPRPRQQTPAATQPAPPQPAPRRLEDEIDELEQMLAAARQHSAMAERQAWDRG